jgi:hypothetical protein
VQKIINSGSIDTFEVDVTFDILSRTALFDTSGTTYLNSPAGAGVAIAFELQDQNGVKNCDIDFDNPQIPDAATTDTYTLDLSYIPYNFLFTAYKITAAIKDDDDTVYYMYFPIKKLCIPKDFTDFGYVEGLFLVKADCTNSVITVKEATNFTYNGSAPTSSVTDGTLYYPLGTIDPITFGDTPFSNNVVYTGTYKVDNTTTGTYDFGDGVFVEIAYVTNSEFTFNCEKSMTDVLCCVADTQKLYEANCDNAKGGRYLQQLQKVSVPLMVGLLKESSGVDASTEAAQIKKILNCDCGRSAIKQVQPDPVNPTIYNIVINGVGGTTVTSGTTGNTKTYVVSSNNYIVGKKNTGDLAYSITVDTQTSKTVKYLLEFDYTVMAGYILTAIENDSSLLTQLNALITATSNIDLSNLDGKCIIDLSSLNYFLTYRVPTIATLVTNIIISGTTYAAPPLLVGDISGTEAWLNGLGLGTFQVSFTTSNGAYYINVITNSNANLITSMAFTASSTVTVAFAKTNRSLVAFLQAVVDYLCDLTGLQVYLGKVISLCSLDYNDAVVTTDYQADSTVSDFLTDAAATICDIVGRIADLTGVTCDKMKEIFESDASGVFGSGDRFYGTMGGLCRAISQEQAALAIIQAIQGNSTVKAAYCLIDCASPATCPDIGNTSLAMSGSDIGVYGVTWTPANPVSTQTVTVRYRINGTLSWTTATNALQILANGNISGSSPYAITGVDSGTTYDVWITNNCGGAGFIKQITTPTGTVYTDDYLLDTIIYNICGQSGVTLYSDAPFGTGVILYTDIGLTVPVTGYDYVAPVSSGAIYEIDNATGVVGDNTGSSCDGGTLGIYILGSDTGTICAGGQTNLYTDGAFAISGTLYLDSGLTSPVTGYDYVVNTANNHIYNLDTVTGVIGSDTGLSCSDNTVQITHTMAGISLTNVTGISGFTPSPALPLAAGNSTFGTHGAFTGSITLTLTGTPIINPSNVTLRVDGVFVQCLSVTSAGTRTFSSRAYATNQIIQIELNTGNC